METIAIDGKLWKYDGPAAWYFLPSSTRQTEEIRKHQKKTVGWKSIPVRVTVGNSTWSTSLFPTKDGPYLLPIKASVRKAESIDEDDRVRAQCVFI